VSYILTERKRVTQSHPQESFDPLHAAGELGNWPPVVGDWEAEKGIYNYGLASAATSPRHLHEWVGGVNCYLNACSKSPPTMERPTSAAAR